VIRRVVSRWQTHATHRFETRFPRNVPPIAADSHRLEQVLDNLLSNVVKYTPEGTQTEVVLAVSRTALQISVRDNGPGIEAEHLPRLFDRFYQAEPPGFGSRRGNGLGLFICKAIVEQHGGQITVDSTREIGTSFSIILPRQRTGTLKVPSSALLEEGESSLELATGDL
jgi:signal transduction histidine kinase